MRLFVELAYTIAVDIDDDVYDLEEQTYEALYEAARHDSDFYELLPDEPIPFVECTINFLDEFEAKWCEGEPAHFELTTRRIPPKVTRTPSPASGRSRAAAVPDTAVAQPLVTPPSGVGRAAAVRDQGGAT